MAAATVELPQFRDPPPNHAGMVETVVHFGNASADTNIGEDGDIVKCIKMFKGTLPVDAEFTFANLDSNASPAQVVAIYFTDGTSTVYLVGSATEGTNVTQSANGGVIKPDFESYANWHNQDIFTSMSWELRVEVITSAATEASGLFSGWVKTVNPT